MGKGMDAEVAEWAGGVGNTFSKVVFFFFFSFLGYILIWRVTKGYKQKMVDGSNEKARPSDF